MYLSHLFLAQNVNKMRKRKLGKMEDSISKTELKNYDTVERKEKKDDRQLYMRHKGRTNRDWSSDDSRKDFSKEMKWTENPIGLNTLRV